MSRLIAIIPGLLPAALVAGVGVLLGHFAPLVGAPVFAIVVGALLGTTFTLLHAERFGAGYRFASRTVLQISIVVLGTGLSLHQVAHVGVTSLPVMLGTLAIGLAGAWIVGNRLGVRGDVRILIGVGTAICGASAIAATTGVIKARQSDVAYAIGTIFSFNIAAVLLFPPLGHALGMSGHEFGLWAGTAVNDTSSVVAAAYSFGHDAGPYAIVVKLTRTLMLIPIVTALSLFRGRGQDADAEQTGSLPWRQLVPVFLVGFLVASFLDTVGAIPTGWNNPLKDVGTDLIAVALAGIGLSLRFSDMRAAGLRPLFLGGVLWVCVAASSLVLQALTGGV